MSKEGKEKGRKEQRGDRVKVFIIKVDSDMAELTVVGRKDAPHKDFSFDATFDAGMSNAGVYDTVLRPSVEEMLQGFNCTVFAYGQTGTGKTYTMEGGLDGGAAWSAEHLQSGMIPRAVSHIFQQLDATATNTDGFEWSVRVSHMELYNEDIIDLLGVASKPLKMYDNGREGGVRVDNLEELPMKSADAIFQVLKRSIKKRKTAETDMNATSSRSHCIFTITVHTKELNEEGEELIRVGKLNLVDLAGSENSRRSGATGGRKREAGMINQSLLTLGRVITALTEGRGHIPYRESKLTRLLQESLGGKAKTSIIATVSPTASNYEETMSTLEYASRAKNIKNKPQQNNRREKRQLIAEYVNEVERLKMRLIAAKEKTGVFIPTKEFKQIEQTAEKQKEQIEETENLIKIKTRQLEELTQLFNKTATNLKETKSTLKQTTQTLSETALKLNTTSINLQETSETLEETRAVVAAQAATETVLHQNATKILETLDSREADVEGLHGKVARQEAVQKFNQSAAVAFAPEQQRETESLSQSVSQMNQQHQQQVSEVQRVITGFVSAKKQESEQMLQQMDALQTLFVENKEILATLCANASSQSNTDVNSLVEANSDITKLLALSVVEYLQESTKAIQSWRHTLKQQAENDRAFTIAVVKSVDGMQERATQWNQAHIASLNSLTEKIHQQTHANTTKNAKLAQQVQTSNSAAAESVQQKEQQLMSQISGLMKNYVGTGNDLREQSVSYLQNGASQFNAALSAQQEYVDTSLSMAQRCCADMGDNHAARVSSLVNSVQQMKQTVTSGVAQSQQQHLETHKGLVDQLDIEIRAVTQIGAEEIAKMSTEAEQSTNNSHTKSVSLVEESEKTLVDGKEDLLEQTLAISATTENSASGDIMWDTLQSVEQNSDANVNDTIDSINTVGQLFTDYVRGIKTTKITGSTPVKRHLAYPKSLPRTAPDEQIISRFHEKQKENL